VAKPVIVSLPRLTTSDALIQWSRHLIDSLQDVMSGKRMGQIHPDSIIGGVTGGAQGPPGPPGPRGPAGPMGPPGPAATGAYRFVQASAAATWTITHNLPFRPNVTAVDSTGREVIPGTIDYTSDISVQLTFSAAVGGEAYLS